MIGSTIGRYEILAALGRGGSAAVYKARETDTGRIVAMKILGRKVSPSLVRRFLLEADILGRLEHPNIVRVYDVAETDEYLLYTLQFVDGSDLAALLDGAAAAGRTVERPTAVAIVLDVLNALHYLGELGLYHRDIKPANILIDNQSRAFLSDFGLARFRDLTRLTASGQAVGTLKYMSPEQLRGEDVDGRSDLYQVGLVLYELLNGTLPNADIESPYSQAMARVSGEVRLPVGGLGGLAEVVERACARDPDGRYQTARDMADALSAAATRSDVAVTPVEFHAPSAELVSDTANLRIARSTTVQRSVRRPATGLSTLWAVTGCLVGLALTVTTFLLCRPAPSPLAGIRLDLAAGQATVAARKLDVYLGRLPPGPPQPEERPLLTELLSTALTGLTTATDGPRLAASLYRRSRAWFEPPDDGSAALGALLTRFAARTDEGARELLLAASEDLLLPPAAALPLTTAAEVDVPLVLERAIHACPSSVECWLRLAESHRTTGRPEWAAAACRRALALDGDCRLGRVMLAEVLTEPPSAARWFEVQRLVGSDEGWQAAAPSLRARRLVVRSRYDELAGDDDRAEQRLTEAFGLDDGYDVAMACARHFARRGLGQKTRLYLDAALRHRPDDVQLLLEVVFRVPELEVTRANGLLARLRDRDDELERTIEQLHAAQRRGGDLLVQAEPLARAVLARIPAEGFATSVLASLRLVQGRLDEAESILRTGLAPWPDRPWLLTLFGSLHERRGELELAVERFQGALRGNPTCGDSLLALGRLLERLGRHDELVALYRGLYDQDPLDVRRVVNYARSLDGAGRLGEAAGVIETYLAVPVSELPVPNVVDVAMRQVEPPAVRRARHLAALVPRLFDLYLRAGRWSDACTLLDGAIARSTLVGRGDLRRHLNTQSIAVINATEEEMTTLRKVLEAVSPDEPPCPPELEPRRAALQQRLTDELERYDRLSKAANAMLSGRR